MNTYLLVDLGALIIPLVCSFLPRFPFYKEWKFFFPANIIIAILFILWDIYFTHIGVWGFNPLHLEGIYISNLPLEELLFFICIPYACVYTYYGLQKLSPAVKIYGKKILALLSWMLLAIGLLSFFRWYTSATFFLLFVLLRFLVANARSYKLDHMVASYALILFPFFLTNGILTGSWIAEEVVWYNDLENLGIRIGTIPVEDTMYGMLLIFSNIILYEWFRDRWQPEVAREGNGAAPIMNL